ncbi:MAG: HAD family phosphatase [Chitinophagaceae bacterium]|nr:MAG: HAD family phosphatase [Chitinophagaceae bacterium]
MASSLKALKRSTANFGSAESRDYYHTQNHFVIKDIIFDLGGVLIDWNPAYVFDPLFEGRPKDREFFFNEVCTSDWNEEQDAGRPLREATELLVAQHPDWKQYIEAYYGRWEEMLGGPIEDTVSIFRQLKEERRFKVYALTNWSAELFPIALDRYDFLHWFDGRVVSGEEKMRKPASEFYQLMLDRFHLQPSTTLFIDDNKRNIDAAAAMGIQCIWFRSPSQLKDDLLQRGLLQ